MRYQLEEEEEAGQSGSEQESSVFDSFNEHFEFKQSVEKCAQLLKTRAQKHVVNKRFSK
jgi:hypothetical protein